MSSKTDSGCDAIRRWAIVAANVTGRQHSMRREPGQDRFFVRQVFESSTGRTLLVLAAADGAGSARKSWAGAWAACRSIQRDIEALARREFDGISIYRTQYWTEAVIERLFRTARMRVKNWCRLMNANFEELSTTLNLAVIGDDFARFAQVGDGIMGYCDEDTGGVWHLAVEPDIGEFEGETSFLTTPDWRIGLRSLAIERAPKRSFVATDGIGPILYDRRAGAIHSRFVDPLFEALGGRSEPAFEPSARLYGFLSSDRVAEICTDDLTLVLTWQVSGCAEVDETRKER